MTTPLTPQQETPVKKTPQQAAMDRLINLHDTVTKTHDRAVVLLDIALNDAVNYSRMTQPGTSVPSILSDMSITSLTQLKMELSGLVAYYAGQKEQFQTSMDAVAKRVADGAAAVAAALTPPPEPEKVVETVEMLRARITKLAADKVIAETGGEEQQQTQTVETMPVQEPVVEIRGLPPVISIADRRDSVESARPPAAPENSIERLLGANSPLLDIFSAGPWLENGKGLITVGSPGFKWYKATDPMLHAGVARATLPTGFYGGESIPKKVLLRLNKYIICWGFGLDAEDMCIYVVGLSDTKAAEARWFKPTDLSASYTRQLIVELLEVVEKYKTGVN